MQYTQFRQTPYPVPFIFSGLAFNATIMISVSAGDTSYIHGVTPPSPEGRLIHFVNRLAGTSGQQVLLELIEEPDIETPGTTEIPSFNRDRRSTNGADFIMYSNPEGISGGTTIEQVLLPAGGGGPGGGQISGSFVNTMGYERLMKPDTDYIISLTNQGDSTTEIYVYWLWYESQN